MPTATVGTVHGVDGKTQNGFSPSAGGENAELMEYITLTDNFHSLPMKLFIDRTALDYANSEPDLERARDILYEIVRSNEDCPFDNNCELKRRVRSLRGESIAVKLSKDIYT